MALGYVHKSARLLDAHLKRVHGAADSDKTITIEPSCLAGVIVKSALAEVRISMALKPQRLSKCTPLVSEMPAGYCHFIAVADFLFR